MDVLRRNTDYALRAAVRLAQESNGRAVSTRAIAKAEAIPYQLACKLMQKLNKAGLVESAMGPTGGFRLSKNLRDINLLDIIEAIQGPLSLNRCVLGADCCPVGGKCTISAKLKQLQGQINECLAEVTLAELVEKRAESATKERE
jgi:Rrf2 family protein